MRHQLKPTPSARARLRYITRQGRYAVGLDGRRDDLRATGSAHLPAWAGGAAEQFWSAADGHERANARRCLELELNLPRELDTAQQVAAVQDYIARLSAEAGLMPCTWAIHDAGDGNPHCHLMIQERPLDGYERTAETWFRRANRQQPERGGSLKSQWWHDREHVFWSRALWADACNQALIRAGHEARFDHRLKSVQRDEALRAGDLRRAAALGTLTERHEGVAVAGMRRRVERGEIEHEDLPDYARDLIEQNDRARAYNCILRDWARIAPEAELREHLAPDLAALREQNPGAQVAAWEAAQQHSAALDELEQALGVARAALAAQQAEIEKLRAAIAEARPEYVREAVRLSGEVDAAKRAAAAWRVVHNVRAGIADACGITLACDAEVARACEALSSYSRRDEALTWSKERSAQQQRLPMLEQGMPALADSVREAEAALLARQPRSAQQQHVRDDLRSVAGLEQRMEAADRREFRQRRAEVMALAREARTSAERAQVCLAARDLVGPAQAAAEAGDRAALGDVARDLRRAVGLVNNELTWCAHGERPRLFALRREIEQQQQALKCLCEPLPLPAEISAVREAAAACLAKVRGWREAENAACAAAEGLGEPEHLPSQPDDDDSRPRSRGPSLG